MDTNALKKFAQEARRELLEQVEARLEQVLYTDSVELREKLGVVNELRAQLQKKTKENLIEEVAYTWFNRFCALRYMDVNHITKIGVVSPMPNFTQPEILQEAKQGIFDKEWQLDRSRVRGLLDGSIPSSNPEGEAYRLLLVAVCNSYAEEMDFLFPRIEDYTELLMPEDLLSTQSVLHSVREALTEQVCQDVEVIGWLYQFYISEKKDEVMGQKGKVAKEDIPAVTQLFTPHWIVRYMVENSLGRLWLLNHPGSKIRNQMEYYIEPQQKETDFLVVDSPEELKILDPACGSGHILTYAFDLLYAIYEEMGYDPITIPQLILEKNLYGIEIDKRAAMLSSFALMMKAVEKDKRFFARDVQPNILEMEDISFEPKDVKAYMAKVGEDLWTQELWEGLQQFENAKTFGSLIRPTLKDVPELRERLKSKGIFEELFLSNTNEKVQKVLEMSEYLSPRYHVVVANPPYFGKSMNSNYKQFAKDHYPGFKKDTFAMFVKRNSELSLSGGQLGFMTPFVWMFISSYEDMRQYLINKKTITSLVQLEYSGFDGATVPICSFTLENNYKPEFQGGYIRLSDFRGADKQAPKTKEAIVDPDCGWFFRISANKFKRIPSIPISYWISNKILDLYQNNLIGDDFEAKEGVGTRNDKVFLKYFWEVNKNSIGKERRWLLTDKAGEFRKWYLGFIYVMDWEDDGKRIKNYTYPDGRLRSRPQNTQYLYKSGVSWGKVGSGISSFRWRPEGYGFNDAAPTLFGEGVKKLLGQLNSKLTKEILKIRGSTLNLTTGVVLEIPNLVTSKIKEKTISFVNELIEISKNDWDLFEISWGFSKASLLGQISLPSEILLSEQYYHLRNEWQNLYDRMFNLEKENNTIYLKAYGLENELEPEFPKEEITLSTNPYYRYGSDYSKPELESRLKEDTIKEFISYAVGCMFGRYSLDKTGLILANQGDAVEDYQRIIGDTPIFAPTETNVIPILEGEWFADDILAQFKKFLRITFGEENFAENLRFIEEALGKDLQKYFLRDFYKDHVQMYKKCPIYWLFSSPNGSFNALIYMHRYTPETVSVVLNQYLREYRDKLTAHRTNLERISNNASARDKSQALKEIEDITKILAELKEYEDEILYPLASRQIQIDLDDGVEVNYAKFGKALKKI